MADKYLSSVEAIENKQSFYNVIKTTGWADTPFFASINSVSFGHKDPNGGHTWFYRKRPVGDDENAYKEGSKRAEVEHYKASKLFNELQIFKKSYGITGSQEGVLSVEGKADALSVQSELSAIDLRLSVEKALLSDKAPSSTGGLRKMGGAFHYVTESIDANQAVLDWKEHVKEALKMMWLNGCAANFMMVSPDQKDVLDDMLDVKKRYGKQDKGIVDNFSLIEDAGYAKGVKIFASPHLKAGDVVFYNSRFIDVVLHRSIKGRDASDKAIDAKAYEHLFELTYQITDPYAMVMVKNLKA